MAKVAAPLLSFSASGQIGQSMVFADWKGIPYARRYAVPANPRSTGQSLTRNVFRWLSEVYKTAPPNFRATWARYAVGKPLTDRNGFFAKNVGFLREAADVEGMIMSPGAFGGLAGSFAVVPGNDLLTVNGTEPAVLPAGWSITKFIAAAIRNQDPQADAMYVITEGTDATAAYSVVLAGLDSAAEYAVAGWFEFQRSASLVDLAYGPASTVLETTT